MRNYGRSFVNVVVPRCQGSSAKGYEREGCQVQTAVLLEGLESRENANVLPEIPHIFMLQSLF